MPPVISALNPVQGPAAGGNEVTITGTSLIGATAVRFGATNAAYTVAASNTIRATAPPGSGQVSVTVRTPAGTSNGLIYTYAFTPVIAALVPGQGPGSGGNDVAITGSNLAHATAVRFGSSNALFTVDSGTHITATAPAGAGSVPVSVTTPGGTSNSVTYAYVTTPPPTLIDLNPHLGRTGGGNPVIITGTHLTGTTAVLFGAQAATGISVQGDNQITVLAPPGTDSVAVTVTTPGGTSQPTMGNPYYTYVQQPVITNLTPSQGSASGGTNVAVDGIHLTYTDQVLIGSTPADFAAVSDDLLIVTTPPGTGTVPISVHTPGGTSNSLTYTYEV